MEISDEEGWQLEVEGTVRVINGMIDDLKINEKPIYFLNDQELNIPVEETFPVELQNLVADSAIFLTHTPAIAKFGMDGQYGAWYFYKDYINPEIDTDLTTIEKDGFQPKYAIDYTVFPNKTSDRINYSFNLSQAGRVSVKIVSVNGQLEFELTDGLVTGFHQFDIDVSRLSNGNYFLVLETNGELQSRPFP